MGKKATDEKGEEGCKRRDGCKENACKSGGATDEDEKKKRMGEAAMPKGRAGERSGARPDDEVKVEVGDPRADDAGGARRKEVVRGSARGGKSERGGEVCAKKH